MLQTFKKVYFENVQRNCQMIGDEKLYEIIIIGAGVSGLSCAYHLTHEYHIDPAQILIVDAQSYVGGRVLQELNFIPSTKIDLGAEILHGKNTLINEFAAKFHEPVEEIFCWAQGGTNTGFQSIDNVLDGGPLIHDVDGKYGLYYIKRKNETSQPPPTLLRYDDIDEEFQATNRILWSLSELDDSKVDCRTSLQDYLIGTEDLSESMLTMVNAGFSNTLCSSSTNLPLHHIIKWLRTWNSLDIEEGEFRFVNSYSALIDGLKSGLNIQLDTPIQWIVSDRKETDDEDSTVSLHAYDGKQFQARAVAVTSSIHVLKNNLIQFDPPLSPAKLLALDAVIIQPVVKVIVKFSAVAWPEGLQGMIMADDDFLFPEAWFIVLKTHCTSNPKEEAVCYAVGFAAASYAAKIIEMNEEDVYMSFVRQLDQVFSLLEPRHMSAKPVDTSLQTTVFDSMCDGIALLPKPSDVYLGGMMHVWSERDHPFIGGGYASPIVSQHDTHDYAQVLAAPIEGQSIFFAGEATNIGAGATAHAALESGIRAADQIAQHFQLSKKIN